MQVRKLKTEKISPEDLEKRKMSHDVSQNGLYDA